MGLLEYLQELSLAHGISGREDSVRGIMERELKKYCEEVFTDRFGNLIARIGDRGPKLMLAAHMDEIGLMVKYIDEKGFLKFVKVGGINDQMLLNQKVIIHTEDGKGIVGVLGSKPPHKMKDEERNRMIKSEDMFIDVGAKDRRDAKRMGIDIGAWATFKSEFDILGNNRVTCKAFDDRAGCAILLEVARRVNKEDLNCQLYLVGTVQEEVGLKGAKTSAFRINPDVAIALDVTICGDHPGIKIEDAPVELGKGPVVCIVDSAGRGLIAHRDLLRMIEDVSKRYNIPVQYEVGEGGTTDGTAIHLTREGIPTGVISVPARYIHTPVEVIDLSDLENTADLIVRCIEVVDKYF
ncbi:MAG TPA: M42 family peptidase [Methanothermococcus okinawensis]|uniref:M42 family peptidase n=1 Tax=Methanothermococcus okinawensis TaxID=155863 RepID=A0A832ZLI2_9EURY|nr:M42 family peptidase [Methanococcaceae archaeon]HIP84032.1 M42 family peptidase [Methanothermococcus okinawensis]HIP91056.1 M42 family peptidase [Methanothermococcus okinawensis]